MNFKQLIYTFKSCSSKLGVARSAHHHLESPLGEAESPPKLSVGNGLDDENLGRDVVWGQRPGTDQQMDLDLVY